MYFQIVKTIILILILAFNSVFGQLSGFYTIGSGGNYPTIKSAIDELYSLGVDGSVTFRIFSGTYNEQLDFIGVITGTGLLKTVKFQSFSGNPEDVNITYSSTLSTNNYVCKIKSTRHLLFQNLTFTAGGTTYARVIDIETTIGPVTFENNIFNGYSTNTTTDDQNIVNAELGQINKITFTNNEFNNGHIGINLVPTITSQHLSIYDNTFNANNHYGINLNDFGAPEIGSNFFNEIVNRSISIINCSGELLIEKNTISNVVNTFSTGIYLSSCVGTSVERGLVVNNFIQASWSGIDVNSCEWLTIYFNSVNITLDPLSNNIDTHALYLLSGSSSILVKNNVLANRRTGYAYSTLSPSQVVASDYNLLYTNGANIAKWDGLNYSTMTDFQTASGMETNSVNADPRFASNTDLHSYSPDIDDEGTDIFGIDYDYDGEIRSSTPSIGADEFTATPLSGSYTIGTGGDYITIAQAIDALYLLGMDGAVEFNVLPGIYNEKLFLNGTVPGISETNTLTFRSSTNNANDVEIKNNATSSIGNYVVFMTNIHHVRFYNITFTSEGTDYSRVVEMENLSDGNITFEGNIFNGYENSEISTNFDQILIYYGDYLTAFPNLTITNNQFNFGHDAILINSESGENVIISNNTFNNQTSDGIFLSSPDGPKIISNIFNNVFGFGINLYQCNDSTLIEKNNIIYLEDSGGSGIKLHDCDGTATRSLLIKNNFIQVLGNGIELINSDYINIYNNSINIDDGNEGVIKYNPNAIDVEGNTNLNIVNNIMSNSEGGYCIDAGSSSTAQILRLDFNVYFITYAGSDVARWNGTSQKTLIDFQASSGHDNNSFETNPHFVTYFDLHSGSNVLARSGDPLANVTEDFDGETRDSQFPSIGADEFIISPLSGIYTVGTGGDYKTMQSAAHDVVSNGISGPVTFNLLSQTFEEQIVFYDKINGADSMNRVTFKSISDDAADAVITYDPTNFYENYVILVDSTSHLEFKNITFSTTSSGDYARIIHVTNSEGGILFKNNIFNGTQNATSIVNQEILYIGNTNGNMENVLIVDNEFTYGYTAINVNSLATSNLQIRDNIFNNSVSGISITNALSPLIESNIYNNIENKSIQLWYCSDSVIIKNNQIISPGHNTSTGIYVNDFQGNSSVRGIIFNNFITVCNEGIQVFGSEYLSIYNNSILIRDLSNTADAQSVGIDITNSNDSLNIINNLVKNRREGYALSVGISPEAQVNLSDHNNFHTNGDFLTYWNNSAQTTLPIFRSVSDKDLNSTNINVQFNSISDLHLAGLSISNNDLLGTDLQSVNRDIDGELRGSPPRKGADEPSQISIDLKIYLEGPYNGAGSHTNSISSLPDFPADQPFNIQPWNYSGNESISNPPSNIVDWVLVALKRDIDTLNPNPETALYVTRKAGILKTDGYIVNTDGSPINFTIEPGNYYLVVVHRNHLEIMSANPVPFTGN